MSETGMSDGERLEAVFQALDRPVAVAVSGGIDSLTLMTLAHRLRPDASAVHAVSPAVPPEATARVRALAADQGWTLRLIDAGEFADAAYRANPVNRCFFCKSNLYAGIAAHVDGQMLSGANLDDLGEYRPGLDAARAHGVRHPYLEAKIDKVGVRRLARGAGLGDLAELPAAPCLSSRVETGIAIQPDVLAGIHTVERRLARVFPTGTVRCRVRAGGVVIELDPASLAALTEAERELTRQQVLAVLGDAVGSGGLRFAPYRNGSAFLRGAS